MLNGFEECRHPTLGHRLARNLTIPGEIMWDFVNDCDGRRGGIDGVAHLGFSDPRDQAPAKSAACRLTLSAPHSILRIAFFNKGAGRINSVNKKAVSQAVHIRSLKVFFDVVRKRSFSQAAEEHGMTQSAASQSVQHLEEFLGVKLIDRTKRPFILTAEGQKFYDGLGGILRQFDTLVDEVRVGSASSQGVTGHVVIASIYSMGLSYLPTLEEEFSRQHSRTSLTYQLAHPHEVYRMVEQGTVDFGMVSYPETKHTIQSTKWRDEPMVLVASPRHRLSMLGEPIKPSDLSQVGLVAFASNLRIRQEIDKELRALGITMRIVVELDNIDSVKHAAIVNSGVAILPKLTVQSELAAGSLKMIECEGLELTRPLGIIQRRDVSMTRAARAFMEMIMRHRVWEGDTARFLSRDASQEGADSLARAVAT
jgi:DNA-binding transcriptional LysR family regulator